MLPYFCLQKTKLKEGDCSLRRHSLNNKFTGLWFLDFGNFRKMKIQGLPLKAIFQWSLFISLHWLFRIFKHQSAVIYLQQFTFTFLHVCSNTCHWIHVEIRGQLSEVSSRIHHLGSLIWHMLLHILKKCFGWLSHLTSLQKRLNRCLTRCFHLIFLLL